MTPRDGAAWVSVERAELDAQRFWSMVSEELRAAAPETAVEPLAPTPSFDGRAAVTRLLGQLGDLEQRLILVIDDLHELASPSARHDLAYLLDHLPETLHVVLITRRDLPLGLHRHRLAGRLSELRSEDLRFSLYETRAMLRTAGVELSDEGAQQLNTQTEGWAAGLRLATMSLQASADREAFVRQFSGRERTVAEYLIAEVLESQALEVRHLLKRASILRRVNGELGDLLAGGTSAGQRLQELADTGGFVVAIDPESGWFRLHHLFADLLAVQLRNEEPDEIQRLHAIAARWFSEHGDPAEAIRHAQAAGEREQAAALLLEHYFSLMLDGRRETARALLDAFDRDPISADAELALVAASEELFTGSLHQAAAHLALATRHADTVPAERRRRFESVRLITKLSLARRQGDFRSVADEMPSGIVDPDNFGDIALSNDVRALALMNVGIFEVWSGRSEVGAQQLEQAQELARRNERPYMEVACRAHLAQAIADRSFSSARVAAYDAVVLAESHGWGSDVVIAPALVTLGLSMMQAGRLEEAEQWLHRAGAALHSGVEPAIGFVLHLAHGGLDQANGQADAALASFRRAEEHGLLLVSGSPLARQLRSSLLRARLDRGDIADVRASLADLPEGGAQRRRVPRDCRHGCFG